MKKIFLVSLFALLALLPVALAEEASINAKMAKETAITARYTPDFKSMTRTVGTKVVTRPSLTRENFHKITKQITDCRKSCIEGYRMCLKKCNGKATRSICPKTCKNENNNCFDTCAAGFIRR